MKLILLTFLAFLQIPSSLLSIAESSEQQSDILFNSKTLKCEFTLGLTVDWDKGKPVYSESNSKMSFYFSGIDPNNETATMIGNGGSAEVVTFVNRSKGITFLEITPTGNLNLTTVFNALLDGTNKYIAVHSRHVKIVAPLPSQYHGTCVPWN